MKHIAIIGGGVVGTATLEALTRLAPGWQITLLEKEARLAAHQSGRNSGVIHSGIYYKPGSLKARFCRRGKELLGQFCRQQGIHFERRGKLISAFDENQEEALSALWQRGQTNGVDCRLLSARQARELEPRLKTVGAIEVMETGIIDYSQVTDRLAQLAKKRGSQIHLRTALERIEVRGEKVFLATNQGRLKVDGYLNCAGLHSDQVAKSAGLSLDASIIPFRGEYYKLKEGVQKHLSGRLLYPVPDPRFPFLGVHITPTLAGEFLCGPNAVLALAREGYHWRKVNLAHLWRLLTDPGFLRLVSKHWRFGFGEMKRSLSRWRFSVSVGRLIEGVSKGDLVEASSGVRAQLVTSQGDLVDDFFIRESQCGLHLLNAPSPAATAALRIGQELSRRALKLFT